MVGRAWKFGDNIDTDVIIPARYLVTQDVLELGRHCMEGIAPDFSSKVSKGDIIVAGRNFGCGSSREHAPLAILGSGISAVIAVSFARIFFRNSINVGLPVLICKDVVEECDEGDLLEIDLESGRIYNKTKDKEYRSESYPPQLVEIIKSGGLTNYTRRRLGINV
ncbi:MAG: 3-isopropylmalate dehydratase small subunit [bacterium]|nr:3-isopropylmalate dehydratase small subunit [bacterium]